MHKKSDSHNNNICYYLISDPRQAQHFTKLGRWITLVQPVSIIEMAQINIYIYFCFVESLCILVQMILISVYEIV